MQHTRYRGMARRFLTISWRDRVCHEKGGPESIDQRASYITSVITQ